MQAHIYVRRCMPIVLIVIASIFLSSRPIHDVTFMNIIKHGYYSRAALVFLHMLFVRLLFKGGYYSGCSFYSNKYSNKQAKAVEIIYVKEKILPSIPAERERMEYT